MSQPTPLKPKPRRSLQWSVPPPPPKRRIITPWFLRQAALCCALVLLAVCYAGPLKQDATTVLAVKRELPVYSVEREDDVITVSFDASWGGDQTLRILDLLDEYNAKATFFLVGIWVDKYPELVKEIHARGHEIGNHSDSHPEMSKLSNEQIIRELDGCSDKIEALTGERPTSFRPPYGDYDNEVVTVARSEGYEVVQWSIDSQDWADKYRRKPDAIVRRVTGENAVSGAVIQFHLNGYNTAQVLDEVIPHYQKTCGFAVVTVGELLALSGRELPPLPQDPAAE